MSPEVLHGQGYDYKSDVWSLGCMLYELSTLKSPFEGPNQTLYDIFKRINNGEYEPIPETFSQELRNLVTRMLLNDPKRRPTAQEAFTYAKMACEAFNEKPSAYTMMLNIVDKCKLLDYERNLQVHTMTSVHLAMGVNLRVCFHMLT
jgi:serine/threonine protein kinase